MALVLITHTTWALRPKWRQRVAVMYAGQIIEERSAQALFNTPQHPYTEASAVCAERATGAAVTGNDSAWCPVSMTGQAVAFSHRAVPTLPSIHSRPFPPCALVDGMVRCHHALGDPAREANILNDQPVSGGVAAEHPDSNNANDFSERSPARSLLKVRNQTSTRSAAACSRHPICRL
jgi:dipeptide transport system ATP-binding protein